MKRTVIVYEEKPGLWAIECPSIGTYSSGTSYEDALEMIKDATRLHFATGGTADYPNDVNVQLASVEFPDEWAKPAGNLGWARAFEIFHEYDKVNVHVAAEHDTIYAGPEPASVSAEHLALLELLGWEADEELGCFYHNT